MKAKKKASSKSRTTTVREIKRALESFAPARLALEWDNCGLQTGHPDAEVTRVLLALDPTPDTIRRAIADKAQMIISHHPLIFKPLRRIDEEDATGALLAELIRERIALLAMHTNLDLAPGGVNDALAEALKLRKIVPLKTVSSEKLLKLAVFVPESHLEAVRQAICDAGAGVIGNYSFCTFRVSGTGSFLPNEKADPYLGKSGRLEEAAELRLEVLCPDSRLNHVIQAMKAAHPYEEVAYDVYPLENKGTAFALGRCGELPEALSEKDFCALVKKSLGAETLRLSGKSRDKIRKVAVCGGSGGDLLPEALRAKCDALITGDVKYHSALESAQRPILLVDAGHYHTERVVLPVIAAQLRKSFPQLAVDAPEVGDVFRFC